MRTHIRKNLAIFIMACSMSLLPSFSSRNTTAFRNAEVASNETYQEPLLDEQFYTITMENAYYSILKRDLDFESMQLKRQVNNLLEAFPNDQFTTTEQSPVESTLMGTNLPFIETKLADIDKKSHVKVNQLSTESYSLDADLDVENNDTTIGIIKDGYIDGLEESEYWWLCKIVMAEVGYASYEIQRIIACEVLNRLKCWYFPDTIEEVIMQPGQYYNGPPCFTDSNGVWREVEESDITDSVKKAVHSALVDGVDYSNGAYFHIEPSSLSQSVIDNFYNLYGEPCLEFEGGLFFTTDLCDSLEEWQEKYILNN